ncbi:TPA: HK97 gp10 family phage protein, partial [Vibrio parahaemolyticus]|nr:HK97 gp10 family phage protein [Vibrio parahaemolyticus]
MKFTSKAFGFKELDKALEALADEKGKEWKRAVLVTGAKRGMTEVLRTAKARIPTRTGHAKNSMQVPTPKYNYAANAGSAFKNSGGMKKGRRHEVTANINFSDKSIRYPYVLNHGVQRTKIHIRNQTFGRKTKPYAVETKKRKPIAFLHGALATKRLKAIAELKKSI